MAEKALFYQGQGGSMRPLLRSGQFLSLAPAPPNRIRMGDCLAYKLDDRIFVHRVWWKGESGLWMNDDAATTSLHFVPYSSIQGKLMDGSPFQRGMMGWVWGLFSHLFFNLKNILSDS